MDMSNIESDPNPVRRASGPPPGGSDFAARVALLSERQRSYLRLVLEHKTSKEIAAATGSTSYRAVDKQLLKANAILGVTTRVEAARAVAAFEQGVEPLHPANALPSAPHDPTLSRPWPTAGAAVNMLRWKQVATWTTIVSIVTPVGLTTAGMAYLTLLLLLRLEPY